MPIHQEIDNAHAYFMQYDTDANKEGAQYFFGFGILHRFELALEMARGSEDTRYFREDLSRDIPTLNTIIGNCLNGRMPRTEAE